MRTLTGGMLLCLLLSVTGCASTSPAPLCAPQRCLAPVVDPTLQGGLVEALRAYHAALEACNASNGFMPEEVQNVGPP